MRVLHKILRRLLNIRGEEVATVPFGANGMIFAEVLKQSTDLEGGLGHLRETKSALDTIISIIEATHAGAEIDEQALSSAEKSLEDGLVPLLDPALGLKEDQIEKALKGVDFALQKATDDPDAAIALGEIKAILSERAPSDRVDKGMPPAGMEGGHDSPPKGYPKDKSSYADPANYRYPLDTEKHVKAAISYLSQKDNAGKYSKSQLDFMWARIRKAAKKHGIDLDEETGKKHSDKEDKSMSKGTIKLVYAGDTPLSGDLTVGDGESVALKEMSEHILNDVEPGKYAVSLKCGDGWDFETEVAVEEGGESTVDVAFEDKKGKPPWLKDDDDEEKDKGKKSDKKGKKSDKADKDVEGDKVEDDSDDPGEADKADPDKDKKGKADKDVEGGKGAEGEPDSHPSFEEKTANALDEIATGLKGLTSEIKSLGERVSNVESSQEQQAKARADKERSDVEEEWSMIPGTMPSYGRDDKGSDDAVDMSDFVDPMDLTSSPLFEKAKQAHKKGNLG